MDGYSAHAILVEKISDAIQEVIKDHKVEYGSIVERAPPDKGDLTINAIRIARSDEAAIKLAEKIANVLTTRVDLIGKVYIENNYVNIKVDPYKYGVIVWNIVSNQKENYGFNPHPQPKNIIVEHTSANPVHPLHIGHLRNCVIGDALARILKARGHKVNTHFYVDDVGLQMAYAAYGFEKAAMLQKDIKPDHYVGLLYAATNAVVNVYLLRKEREKANPEERARIDKELSEWLWVSKELMEKDEEIFTVIANAAMHEDPYARICDINRAYEAGEEWAVALVRRVANLCIDGFKKTLERLGISFDSWDWESEVTTWNGLVTEVLRGLRQSGLVIEKQGALIFEADKLAESHEIRQKLGLPRNYGISRLTLVRSDGTTLYPTRDIAYTLYKFQTGADKVINVVGAQQALEQIQVRLALYALGKAKEAENTIHFAYEMVTLPGVKMSGRRGRYVSADELLDEAVKRAGEELVKRGLELAENRDVAEKVGLGAVKFALLSISPSRPLMFSWDKVLDFDKNSGPFVQYAYVRARSVLRKAGSLKPLVTEGAFGEDERKIVFLVGYFPEVVAKSADELKVELIPQYLNELALAFNKYYDEVPILKAETLEKVQARLALTLMVAVTLENGMKLIGIEPPHRM
ncbi:MAG: arginine--tRNA ligase [Thermofilaceae archaeon]|nr:arginine--tRNA ligase [Thermofilaceae archaeon]MCX8180571.1 arginine--tRNA ligase [Thermofilaceae archaeon]MDW8003673.1 arginine--tRNA ligase [Thermofilaceae archaeon]